MAVGRNGYGVVTSGATQSGIEPAANVAIKIDWPTPGDQRNEGWRRSFFGNISSVPRLNSDTTGSFPELETESGTGHGQASIRIFG